MKFDICGSGALNWDIFYQVEDLSELPLKNALPGSEFVLSRKDFFNLLDYLQKKGKFLFEGGGGSSANTIFALGLWGFRCTLFSITGDDEFGKKILKELEKAEVSTEYMLQKAETSLALIILDKKKDRFIAVSPGNCENYISELFKNEFPETKLWHFSSFASSEGQNFQKELISRLRDKKHTKVSFDPGEVYARKGKEFFLPFLKRCNLLFITKKELNLFSFDVKELLKLGVEKVFLKKGKEGAELISAEGRFMERALSVKKVVDNTGAGDYFNAGVLAGILKGLRDVQILKLGIYSAGISLRNYGRAGCLSKKEFENYINLVK
jgi:ribokinase